jgi:uncharacterized protein (TIGR02145 family)
VVFGKIDLTISGGIGPFKYTINGSAIWQTIYGSFYTIDNLPEGSYKIVIMDANDCTYELNLRIIRIIEMAKLLDCDAMIDREAEEDYYQACRYTHEGYDWDAVFIYADVELDSLHYYINDVLVSSSPDATLDGAIFPLGVSEVMVVAFLEDVSDTCRFLVTVTRVCPDSVKDIEGHAYKVTKLAGECWTSNLRSTVYADNTQIVWAKPYTNFLYPDTEANTEIFGLLYTWYSAVGVAEGSTELPVPDIYGNIQGICPDGWHVPSQAEWNLLSVFPASDLKSTTYWINPGTDLYDFDARGAGKFHGAMNRFEELYGFTGWWTCNISPDIFANYFYLTYYCVNTEQGKTEKGNGLSVRCILDKECKE